MDLKQREAVEEFIEENLAKGFIRQSDSQQAATLFFVAKSDRCLHPVQDYQKLNQQTIQNVYPLARIDELVQNLGEFDFFIKMDI